MVSTSAAVVSRLFEVVLLSPVVVATETLVFSGGVITVVLPSSVVLSVVLTYFVVSELQCVQKITLRLDDRTRFISKFWGNFI